MLPDRLNGNEALPLQAPENRRFSRRANLAADSIAEGRSGSEYGVAFSH